ncbi:MAG: hypothetical protein RSC68_31650, partial [Acinetobacter sp.]
MPTIDFNQTLSEMITAARAVLDKKWPVVKDYAEAELEKLARTLAQIETLKQSGQISEVEAGILFEMQKNTARAVMLSLQGMSLLLVEG